MGRVLSLSVGSSTSLSLTCSVDCSQQCFVALVADALEPQAHQAKASGCSKLKPAATWVGEVHASVMVTGIYIGPHCASHHHRKDKEPSTEGGPLTVSMVPSLVTGRYETSCLLQCSDKESLSPFVCLHLLSQPLPKCNVVPHKGLELLSAVHAHHKPQAQGAEPPASGHHSRSHAFAAASH